MRRARARLVPEDVDGGSERAFDETQRRLDAREIVPAIGDDARDGARARAQGVSQHADEESSVPAFEIGVDSSPGGARRGEGVESRAVERAFEARARAVEIGGGAHGDDDRSGVRARRRVGGDEGRANVDRVGVRVNARGGDDEVIKN